MLLAVSNRRCILVIDSHSRRSIILKLNLTKEGMLHWSNARSRSHRQLRVNRLCFILNLFQYWIIFKATFLWCPRIIKLTHIHWILLWYYILYKIQFIRSMDIIFAVVVPSFSWSVKIWRIPTFLHRGIALNEWVVKILLRGVVYVWVEYLHVLIYLGPVCAKVFGLEEINSLRALHISILHYNYFYFIWIIIQL